MLRCNEYVVVFYPIWPPDPGTGFAAINWIAEITVDNSRGLRDGDWNEKVSIDSLIHHFEGWRYDWLDVGGVVDDIDDVIPAKEREELAAQTTRRRPYELSSFPPTAGPRMDPLELVEEIEHERRVIARRRLRVVGRQ